MIIAQTPTIFSRISIINQNHSGGTTQKESPDTKNFNSKDGKLTFAIITHTAGNGFFDPTYVGAQVAAKAFGINLIMLGSEAPVDDIPRQLEILNQIIQDPMLDGLILTTPQSGAYDDLVATAFEKGIPVATTNSFDPILKNRNQISHTGQAATAAAIGGEAMAKCVLGSGAEIGTILFPNTTTLGNEEVNNRITAASAAPRLCLGTGSRFSQWIAGNQTQSTGVYRHPDFTADRARTGAGAYFRARHQL